VWEKNDIWMVHSLRGWKRKRGGGGGKVMAKKQVVEGEGGRVKTVRRAEKQRARKKEEKGDEKIGGVGMEWPVGNDEMDRENRREERISEKSGRLVELNTGGGNKRINRK